jgi:hypothetical protein
VTRLDHYDVFGLWQLLRDNRRVPCSTQGEVFILHNVIEVICPSPVKQVQTQSNCRRDAGDEQQVHPARVEVTQPCNATSHNAASKRIGICIGVLRVTT